MNNNNNSTEEPKSLNFLEQIIEEDLKSGHIKSVLTRFPPEPNGYLHIGHAKSICLNFGLGITYNGKTNLRFDDTNPAKEDVEYIESIKKDVNWLGFQWQDEPKYASDYFQQLYDWACELINKGLAYVDELNAEQISEYRGTTTEAGKNSPFRDRSAQESLQLFEQMKNGEIEEGKYVLRAKIDMASPNMLLRDPIMYRVLKEDHHRTGDKWSIYPMYDYAHGLSDYIEGITHSICTLEFDVHRPLYDWFIEKLTDTEARPHQHEFARLNLTYTVMSKRKLLKLVEENVVESWDDPRMPTISGLRRRGYSPESIRLFADKVGVAKRDNIIDIALLEYCVREDLNSKANRVMAVLDPVKLIIDNYPENEEEEMSAVNNPEDESAGSRMLPFSKELYIERSDFMEDPPRKFFRLAIDKEVRLRYGGIIKCVSVDKDNDGKITAIHCTYDPESRTGMPNSKRKVKGTIHWVSAKHAIDADVKLYDRLFSDENPDGHKDKDFTEFINEESLEILKNCKLEPSLKNAKPGQYYQFERTGYFCVDSRDFNDGKMSFNRTVGLRDSWSKMQKKK